MYRLTPFSPEHLSSIRVEDSSVLAPISSHEQLVIFYATHPSFSLWCHDKFIGAGGAVVPWKGMGDVWMIMGKEPLELHGKALFKYARVCLGILHNHFGVQRAQAAVQVEQEKWIRYAEALRFKVEGLMLKYGPDGKDYLMMSRTEWDQ